MEHVGGWVGVELCGGVVVDDGVGECDVVCAVVDVHGDVWREWVECWVGADRCWRLRQWGECHGRVEYRGVSANGVHVRRVEQCGGWVRYELCGGVVVCDGVVECDVVCAVDGAFGRGGL